MARAAGADLFISLHADSVGSPIGAQTVRGASVYTLSEQASDKEAEALAAKGPAVIDVRSSLEHISAFTTLSALAPAK